MSAFRELHEAELDVGCLGYVDFAIALASSELRVPLPEVRWYAGTPTHAAARMESEVVIGFVRPEEPTTVWLRADQGIDTVLRVAAHETKHVAQYRYHLPGKDQAEAEACAYAQAFVERHGWRWTPSRRYWPVSR